MSRTPSQQCGHPTPDRPLDPRAYPLDPMPVSYQSYPYHDPRHFRPPEMGYARPELSAPPGPPRLPPLGPRADANPDPRYMVAGENSYINRQSFLHTLPLRMHYQVPAAPDLRTSHGPYEERSSPMISHGRDFPSHRLRTFDLESQ